MSKEQQTYRVDGARVDSTFVPVFPTADAIELTRQQYRDLFGEDNRRGAGTSEGPPEIVQIVDITDDIGVWIYTDSRNREGKRLSYPRKKVDGNYVFFDSGLSPIATDYQQGIRYYAINRVVARWNIDQEIVVFRGQVVFGLSGEIFDAHPLRVFPKTNDK